MNRSRFLLIVIFYMYYVRLSFLQQWKFPSDAQDSEYFTTNSGMPVDNNRDSLTVGPQGPTLLEDYLLLEKLAHFDRERIPERVVHAVGAAARGDFRVTGNVSQWTFANFLQPNKTTPVLVRFSTVIHSLGSPETLRDPRGFAVKFYTEEGNYDLVGNNIPVFFIRDGLRFPDMVHALKPNPVSNRQEWWRIWDFFSHFPESVHMWTWVLADVGIPRDYRHMNGFGVHTFKWINRAGDWVYVKYHFLTRQGVASLIDENEIKEIVSRNHHHATADLYDAIARGDYPKWTLFVQIMSPQQAANEMWDPLDPTLTWPIAKYPLIEVGELTLNRNVDNFFNENEQSAFAPSNIVPGIYYSEDKLLQARLFAYPDTQRYRLGGNYLMLPINRPLNTDTNNMHGGRMNFMERTSHINYFPSSLQQIVEAPKYPTRSEVFTGRAVRSSPKSSASTFAQAQERLRSLPPDEYARFTQRLIDSYQDPRITSDIRNIWIGYWRQVEPSLGDALARNLTVTNK
jgi:catalase